jgi:hypothetical protein
MGNKSLVYIGLLAGVVFGWPALLIVIAWELLEHTGGLSIAKERAHIFLETSVSTGVTGAVLDYLRVKLDITNKKDDGPPTQQHVEVVVQNDNASSPIGQSSVSPAPSYPITTLYSVQQHVVGSQ